MKKTILRSSNTIFFLLLISVSLGLDVDYANSFVPVSVSPQKILRDQYLVFDSFDNDTPRKYIGPRLHAFATTVAEGPKKVGYIVSYASIDGDECEAISYLKFLRSSFVRNEKAILGKIIFVNGGYIEKGRTDFYVIDADQDPPSVTRDFSINDVLKRKDDKRKYPAKRTKKAGGS